MDCFKGFLDCLERKQLLIPFWLVSVNRNKEDTKPHHTYIGPDTLHWYFGYWQWYLLVCIRTTTNDENRIEFTVVQRKCLVNLFILMNKTELNKHAIFAKIFELSVLLAIYSDYAMEHSSLIYLTGIIEYNLEQKQQRQLQEYTTILASLQFCIRMLLSYMQPPILIRSAHKNFITFEINIRRLMPIKQDRGWRKYNILANLAELGCHTL